VRLSDIGSAVLGPENIETKLSQSGLPLIGLAIVPRPEQTI
jgi:HAE1 family hydrophobic/amphiphilic exporter-1/multidrug efflux pump